MALRRQRWRHARVLCALALAVGLAAGCGGSGGRSRPVGLPKSAIAVEIGDTPADRPMPRGFLGISTEYSSLTAYAGRDPRALNPLFVRLLDAIARGGSPVIRFGGDSTDWTWWPTGSAAKPRWARYVLTRLWIEIARALARATHARLILGVNFEADSRGLAGAESKALLDGLGPGVIEAFELGNEPEVYGEIPWYANLHHAGVLGRPASYSFRSYLADFGQISAALPSTVPLAGPALALTWPLTDASRFLALNPRVRLFTLHFYPLKRCYNATSSPTYPTLAHLLSARSGGPPAGTRVAVAAAHSEGATVRVDEINSVSCRGLPGLSDSFASALWLLDALFRFASAGVDGVNIHTLAHVSYEPFSFTRSAGRWEARVMPMYYGMLLFAQASPAGSRLLAVSHQPEPALRTWATRGPDGTTRVVLINDARGQGLTLSVSDGSPARSATLTRLAAPSLTATSGVTLAGQSFGALTTTAALSGRRRLSILTPVHGRYLVGLPAASAALLTLRAR